MARFITEFSDAFTKSLRLTLQDTVAVTTRDSDNVKSTTVALDEVVDECDFDTPLCPELNVDLEDGTPYCRCSALLTLSSKPAVAFSISHSLSSTSISVAFNATIARGKAGWFVDFSSDLCPHSSKCFNAPVWKVLGSIQYPLPA